MIGILLIAHQPLASSLVAVAQHVFGAVERLEAMDIVADADLTKLIIDGQHALNRVDNGQGVLILTDLFGATPANLAASLAKGRTGALVLAGANVPMLLRAICYRTEPLAEVADKASAGAVQGIVKVALMAQSDFDT